MLSEMDYFNAPQWIGRDQKGQIKTVSKVKSKAVPLHAMEAHGGRGGIAPSHS
jgi:hypothetical protein